MRHHALRSTGSFAEDHDGEIPAMAAEAELDGWIAEVASY